MSRPFDRQGRGIGQQPAPIARFAADTIPADEEISGTGILKQVNDTDFPIVILTIELPENKLTDQFTINLEDVTTVQKNTLTQLVGKTISFLYVTEQTNALLEIEVGGRFLLDADINVLKGTTSKVTGELGADEVTTGDVPGLITITAADGEVTEFPFFVTSELLEVNGTTVTAFYEERTRNTVKAVSLAK
ncbi:hypothetical protein [uncultured Fibrella sp.]|uniref:hypothetical protein n=1 Tax=uncultured Fibrella sp. TaxID=1284596 RepID=UPI0035CAEA63